MSILYGVGVGPGDAELLTLKAVRIIQECEVIVVPNRDISKSMAYHIVKDVIPEIEKKEVIAVDMPMTKDATEIDNAHSKAAGTVVSKLNENKDVAFLTLGDPTIYSTYMYIHREVKKQGYEVQIINGIASFLAAASRINDSLVQKDEELHIIPATFETDGIKVYPGTNVYMKAGSRLNDIKKELQGSNRRIFFVENCGLETERVIEGLESIPDEAGYFSMIIVI